MAEILSAEAKRGQRILLIHIGMIVALSISMMGAMAAIKGMETLTEQMVRFLLLFALCCWLYQGSPTAKWITVILSTTGGLLAGALIFSGDVFGIATGGMMGAIYLSFAATLVVSSSVNKFLQHQRGNGMLSG